jgi:site-specific DNA recombinase
MGNNGTTKLRFAALIRVSTEQQEKTGESLRTQRHAIEQAAKDLGGEIVKWYGGQEHATPGWEKKEVTRLLDDAAKERSPFNAVMVAHADRWSRDNRASQTGLDLLKQKRHRFFVLSTEHDLFDPSAQMFLAMSAVIGGYQAAIQNQKSMINRIARARRGVPTCGKLPFGRTFDKKTETWGVDAEKKRMMEDVAQRFIAGEPLPPLARQLGYDYSFLHKTLTRRCGDKWELAFDSDELNIHERVVIDIPCLLSDKTIKAVREKVEANKTYKHRNRDRNYLLQRLVFCDECGYALSGITNHGIKQYYRHPYQHRVRECKAHKHWGTAAADLEHAVLHHLFSMFGNPSAVERAIDAALPNLNAHRQIQDRISKLDNQLKAETDGRQRVLRLVQRGKVGDKEAEKLLDESQSVIAKLQEELDRLNQTVEHTPSRENVRTRARQASKAFVRANAAMGRANHDFSKLTWEDKRELLERVFAGKTAEGQRAGVYIQWPAREGGKTRYTIRGLITRSDVLPMAAGKAAALIDPDYADADPYAAGITKSLLPLATPVHPAH